MAYERIHNDRNSLINIPKMVIRLQNIIRRLIQTWGPVRFKRTLWNKEFASGRWNHLTDTSCDCVYRFIAKYNARGSILDLGCGAGQTGVELNADCFSSYIGVDISDAAVAKAIERAAIAGRSKICRYFQSDLVSFDTIDRFDVILFRDVLYYIPLLQTAALLNAVGGRLKPQGVIIVRLWNREACRKILAILDSTMDIVERFNAENDLTIVVVCRPFPNLALPRGE